MADLVSIIIPVFNGENFVRQCVKSALSQTYSDVEAIIVDDGSSDNTVAIAAKEMESDNRVKCFSINNSGVTAARKAGVEKANGQWICFLDVDDKLPEDAFEAYSAYFDGKPDIIASGVSENMSLSEYKSGLMMRRCHPELWGKLFRTDFIKQYYPTLDRSIIIGEDQTINLVLANNAKNLVTIPRMLYCYNISNPESVTKRFRRTNDYEIKYERLFNEVVRPCFDYEDENLKYAEYKMKIEGFKMVVLDGNRFDPESAEWEAIVNHYNSNSGQLAASEYLIIKLEHCQWLYALIMRVVLFFSKIKKVVISYA